MTYIGCVRVGGIFGLLTFGGVLAQSSEAPATHVSMETCIELVQRTMGGETTHLEFESRNGVPTYEFIVETEAGSTFYVGCDASTGLIGEVDIIVDETDAQFAGRATISAQEAADAATATYPGEVEEVKALLLSNGRVAFEVDVEFEPDGEFNVYVDAETGRIFTVNIEYFEIGQSATSSDQLRDAGAASEEGEGN